MQCVWFLCIKDNSPALAACVVVSLKYVSNVCCDFVCVCSPGYKWKLSLEGFFFLFWVGVIFAVAALGFFVSAHRFLLTEERDC